MNFDAIKGTAAAGAERAKEFINKGAEKAEELGKEGYKTAKEYGAKGFEALKDFGVKAGEKLKPLAKDTAIFSKETYKFVKTNPGKTALIGVAAIALYTGVSKLFSAIFSKAPEKTAEKA